MRIDTFYNEKLPKRTAHDAYIWRGAFYLSEFNHEVTLVTGPLANDFLLKNSTSDPLQAMQAYYLPSAEIAPFQSKEAIANKKTQWPLSRGLKLALGALYSSLNKQEHHSQNLGENSLQENRKTHFHWLQLPLLRKSRFLSISWNLPFFWRCQLWIQAHRPDWAVFSVYKQANFHLKHKVKGVRYLMEVQDLAWYPPQLSVDNPSNPPKALDKFFKETIPEEKLKQIAFQRKVLQSCDAITTTTESLKSILEQFPYQITRPIAVIPLASEHQPLPHTADNNKVSIGYVGQLYPDQGVDALIEALSQVPVTALTQELHLEIIGGHPRDLARLKSLIERLKLESRVHLHGFVSPSHIAPKLAHCQLLAAPFYPTRHMRYVAHTKLADYGRWALPVIAPFIEGIEHEVRTSHFLFNANDYPQNLKSLVEVLIKASSEKERASASLEVSQSLQSQKERFHWKERCQKLSLWLQHPSHSSASTKL